MAETSEQARTDDTSMKVTRRRFILGVIAGGAMATVHYKLIPSAVEFLKAHPHRSRAEIAPGVPGNLCRCQDYTKILETFMQSTENMRRA